MTESNPTRRTLLAGAAWAAPVVVLASAAPLVAASGGQTVFTHGHLSRAVVAAAGDSNVSYVITIDSSEVPSGSTAEPGFWVTNTAAGQEITNATITLWYAQDGLKFTNSSESGWGGMAATGGTMPGPDGTYYAYQATYKSTYTSTSPNSQLPIYKFSADSKVTDLPKYFYISATATYAGTALTYSAGPFDTQTG